MTSTKDPWHVHSGIDTPLSQSNSALLKLQLEIGNEYLDRFQPRGLIACLKALPSLTELHICCNANTAILSCGIMDQARRLGCIFRLKLVSNSFCRP